MFTKIKTFFLLLGYKIKDLPLWDKLREIPRKTWIIIGSCTAGVIALVVAAAILIPMIIAGSGSTNNGATGGVGGNEDTGQVGATSIYISSDPLDKFYYKGEEISYYGLVIGAADRFISYDENPEMFTFSGYDRNTVGEQTITVDYLGLTTTFVVTVAEVPVQAPTLVSVKIDPDNPPKNTCTYGKRPSVKDARLMFEYSDGSVEYVKLSIAEHFGNYEDELFSADVGTTVTIPLVVTKNGKVFNLSYDVTVVAP